MARYVKDFFIKENPVDLLQTIDEYLTEQGYTIVDYKGQQVYQKRSGALTAPSFMRISHKDSTLRFQVWIKFPVLPGVFVGEYDLQGIVGKDIKGPLAERVNTVEKLIQNYIDTLQESVFETAPIIEQEKSDEIYCIACGTKQSRCYSYCFSCGQKLIHPEDIQNNNVSAETTETVPAQDVYISKKEFLKTKCPHSYIVEIRIASIILYVCLGISIIAALSVNPAALIDMGLMLGLTLGMHIGKSQGCAIALFIVCLLETIITFILTQTLGGWIPLALSIWTLTVFIRAAGQYKKYISNL